MPDTLSCVAVDGARESRHADLGDVLRADARLLPQRRHQAEGLAAVLHALAHGVDSRVVGLQRVVHQDAAIAGQVRLLRELDVGPHADGHDHEIRGHFLAAVELHAGDALAAEDGLGLGAHAEFDAALLQRRLEQRAGRARRAGAP